MAVALQTIVSESVSEEVSANLLFDVGWRFERKEDYDSGHS